MEERLKMGQKSVVEVKKHGSCYVNCDSGLAGGDFDAEIESLQCPECMSYDKKAIGINGRKWIEQEVNAGCVRSKRRVVRRFKCLGCGCEYDFVRFSRGKVRWRDLAITIFLSLFLLFGAMCLVSLVADLVVLAVISGAISGVCLWLGAALTEDKLV